MTAEDDSQACTLLRSGLAEAQTNVRSYDTKAQIVGVGYILALGVVGKISTLLGGEMQLGATAVLLAWGIVVMPILFFGYVLYPARKTASYLDSKDHHNNQHVLYIDAAKKKTFEEVRQASLVASPIDELSFELLMVSSLRETKRKRFLRGLFAAALSFLVIFLDQIYRAL